MVLQCLKDHAHVNQVLFLRLGENKNVVHVILNEFPQLRAAPTLGRHAVNLKPKRANAELILAARDPERSLELVLFLDPELMLGVGQV